MISIYREKAIDIVFLEKYNLAFYANSVTGEIIFNRSGFDFKNKIERKETNNLAQCLLKFIEHPKIKRAIKVKIEANSETLIFYYLFCDPRLIFTFSDLEDHIDIDIDFNNYERLNWEGCEVEELNSMKLMTHPTSSIRKFIKFLYTNNN